MHPNQSRRGEGLLSGRSRRLIHPAPPGPVGEERLVSMHRFRDNWVVGWIGSPTRCRSTGAHLMDGDPRERGPRWTQHATRVPGMPSLHPWPLAAEDNQPGHGVWEDLPARSRRLVLDQLDLGPPEDCVRTTQPALYLAIAADPAVRSDRRGDG